MGYIYKNITTVNATHICPILLENGGSDTQYEKITILNTSSASKYTVDLYITRTKTSTASKGQEEFRTYVGQNNDYSPLNTTTKTHYIIKSVHLPVGATLVLDKDDLFFNFEKYDFYIKINDVSGTGVTVDLNIKTNLNTVLGRTISSSSSGSGGSGY